MTEYSEYLVYFRIKKQLGKFDTPESAVKVAAKEVMRALGLQEPNDYTVSKFIERYFHSVERA